MQVQNLNLLGDISHSIFGGYHHNGDYNDGGLLGNISHSIFGGEHGHGAAAVVAPIGLLQNLADASQYWLVPVGGQEKFKVVGKDLSVTQALSAEKLKAILIPPVPEASEERPWTRKSWNEWNLLEHNGTSHPDRQFSQTYGFEPYLI